MRVILAAERNRHSSGKVSFFNVCNAENMSAVSARFSSQQRSAMLAYKAGSPDIVSCGLPCSIRGSEAAVDAAACSRPAACARQPATECMAAFVVVHQVNHHRLTMQDTDICFCGMYYVIVSRFATYCNFKALHAASRGWHAAA